MYSSSAGTGSASADSGSQILADSRQPSGRGIQTLSSTRTRCGRSRRTAFTSDVLLDDLADARVDEVGPVAEGRAMAEALEEMEAAVRRRVGHFLSASRRCLHVVGD